jgi:ribonuclease III
MPLSTKPKEIAVLQEALGHYFRSPELLGQALTHSSHARELETAQGPGKGRAQDNEQLEFLGDAVLALVTSEEIFHRFPHFREGELSKLRAHLVSERHLIKVARELQIGASLRLGRGEEKSGGRAKTAILVDSLEAVLGAIYLDGGLEPARAVILRHVVTPELERMALGGSRLPAGDYKSALQEKLQATGHSQPAYRLVKERGPEHNKTFTVEVRLDPQSDGAEFVGRAEGSTKKSAEQDAARQVLEYLESLPGWADDRADPHEEHR